MSTISPFARFFVLALLLLATAACGEKGKQIRLGNVPFTDHGTKDVKGKTELAFEVDSFYFAPTFLRGEPGQQLKLMIENESSVLHNFSIGAQRVDHDIPARGKAEIEVSFPQFGVVLFICKYHTAQGMNGELLAGDATPQPPPELRAR